MDHRPEDRRLEASRRRVRERLEEVRSALRRETGRAPTSIGWLVPIVGLSAGLALAAVVAAKRRGRRGELEAGDGD